MTNVIKIILMLLLFYSLSIFNVSGQILEGTYIQNENSNIKLHFSKNSFLFEDDSNYTHLVPYHCTDTLASGSWEWDNSKSFIKLYSNPLQITSLIYSNIEENAGKNEDSIYIFIYNPLENNYMKYNAPNEKARIISYRLFVESNNTAFDFKINTKRYRTNKIILKIPDEGIRINTINVTAYPNDCLLGWRDNMPPHPIMILSYDIKNPNANIFNISIPDLTACYLNELRLNGDFVKILSKRKLEWDGKIYKYEKQ